MDKAQILIAGGGIAGLAAAIAVAPRETILLEQASEWSNVGAGLQLGPNAVRALQKLGAWDAVEPITSSPPEIHIRDGVSGRLLKRLHLGASFERRFGAPYRLAHRADLHAALLGFASSLSNLDIRLGQTVSAFGQTEDVISIITANGAYKGSALLAADGVKSSIRQQLFAGSHPRSTGEVYHRALLPHANNTQSVALDCVNVWLYPKGHVVHYLVGTAQHLNLVAITPEHQTPTVFYAKSCHALRNTIDHSQRWTQWPSLYVKTLRQMHMNRILLIGDAAHGTVPYLAQGAAMAFEDSALLKALSQDAIDWANRFRNFSEQRGSRTKRLHQTSLSQGKIYHATGLRRRVVHFGLPTLPQTLFWSHLAWLYKK